VFTIQPLGLGGTKEKLAAVCVRPGVGHGKDSWSCVLEGEVFIWELVSIDGFASSSVVVGEVTSLTHEVGNDSVEGGLLEAEPLLASAESTEVLGCLRDYVLTQLHNNFPEWSPIGGDVEETPDWHFSASFDVPLPVAEVEE